MKLSQRDSFRDGGKRNKTWELLWEIQMNNFNRDLASYWARPGHL